MGADILALQVRKCAVKGGNTYLASASKLFCELVASDPDLVGVLFEPNWPIQLSVYSSLFSCNPLWPLIAKWLFATNTSVPTHNRSGKSGRYALAPLMQYHDDKLMISADPGRLGQHPAAATSSVPALTPTQLRALTALSDAATRHRLPLNPQAGDIIFVNNWALLHAREAYVDTDVIQGLDGASTRRHILRMWLRNSQLGWAVPTAMRAPWEAAFGKDMKSGRRIQQKLYPVMPAPDYKVPKYTAGSAAFVVEDTDESSEAEC